MIFVMYNAVFIGCFFVCVCDIVAVAVFELLLNLEVTDTRNDSHQIGNVLYPKDCFIFFFYNLLDFRKLLLQTPLLFVSFLKSIAA